MFRCLATYSAEIAKTGQDFNARLFLLYPKAGGRLAAEWMPFVDEEWFPGRRHISEELEALAAEISDLRRVHEVCSRTRPGFTGIMILTNALVRQCSASALMKREHQLLCAVAMLDGAEYFAQHDCGSGVSEVLAEGSQVLDLEPIWQILYSLDDVFKMPLPDTTYGGFRLMVMSSSDPGFAAALGFHLMPDGAREAKH